MKSILKKSTYWFSVSIVGIILGVSLQFVSAWVAPSSNPPAGNIGAPINTGDLVQFKSGPVVLNTGGAETGLVVLNGNVGIGVAAPSRELDVLGYVKGSGFCIGNDCINAWPDFVSTMGYIETPYNMGEDIYGSLSSSGSSGDTCETTATKNSSQYNCSPGETKSCIDVFVSGSECTSTCDGSCCGYSDIYQKRSVACMVGKILYKPPTSGFEILEGTVQLLSADYSGDNEWCKVRVKIGSCDVTKTLPNGSAVGTYTPGACEADLEKQIKDQVLCNITNVTSVAWNYSGGTTAVSVVRAK